MRRRNKIKDSIYFVLDVAAGEKGYIEMTEKEAFVAPGSISKVFAQFYAGQENTLLVKPVLVDAQGTYDEIVNTRGDRGKGNICGENEPAELDVDVPFDKGDRVRIYYENTNTSGATYTLKVIVTFNYEGGELLGRSEAIR